MSDINVNVSYGEFIDKITILEVKNAVNEFAKSVNKKQIFLTDFDVWYFYK